MNHELSSISQFITFTPMKSKFRNPVILFFASFLLIGLGIVGKVSHWPHSDIIFGGGMIVQMFSILWLIAVIIRPGKKG